MLAVLINTPSLFSPPHRTKADVKKLAELLRDFPDLLTDKNTNATDMGLWEGLARRATAETINNRKGCARKFGWLVKKVFQRMYGQCTLLRDIHLLHVAIIIYSYYM